MFTLNVRKLFRKNLGSRQSPTPRRRKPPPTFKPELEVLEERSLLSGGSPYATQSTALFWDSTDGTNASNTANWDVGKLGSGVHPTVAPGNAAKYTQGIYFDGSTVNSNQSCTWDYTPTYDVGALTFQNGWTQTVTFLDQKGFSIFGGEVTGDSAPTITPNGSSGANAVAAITLRSGSHFSVTTDSSLYLTGYSSGNAVFFAGDGTIGDFLNNVGTVTYTGHSSGIDYLKVPVLNGANGVFNVNGGGGGVGATLQVSGTDINTNNVSFYQNTASGQTYLSGNVTLWCTNNYMMNGGLLETTDAGPDILKVGTSGNSPVDGTVTLLSGTVNIDKNVNAYGTLWITGTTATNNPILNIGNVTLNFNVNMAVGKNDCSQLIVGNSTGSGRVNFGYDGGTATIDINPQGDTNPGHKWQILFFGSVTGTKNITLSPIRGYTMIWLPNPTNPTRLEIDN